MRKNHGSSDLSRSATWKSMPSVFINDTGGGGGDNDDVEKSGGVPFATVCSEESLIETILDKNRINALLACDTHLITYQPRSFFIIFHLRGRNLSTIWFPLLLVLVWDILWSLLFARVGWTFPSDLLDGLVEPLLTPISFLLVFRLGRAAIRFWDARAAAGKLVEASRALISTTAAATQHMMMMTDGKREQPDPATTKNTDVRHTAAAAAAAAAFRLRQDFARWMCVFPIAVKNFLRSEQRKRGWDKTSRWNKKRFELGRLVRSEEDIQTIIGPQNDEFAPILVLNRLRTLAYEMVQLQQEVDGKREQPPNSSAVSMGLYQHLNDQITVLTGAWGALERINSTPLPFVYVVHLRTFLILYLLLWHIEALSRNGWHAVFALMAASWALLGIEAAAVECERPFQWYSNHLALGKICVVVSKNVAQTLKNSQAAAATGNTPNAALAGPVATSGAKG